MPPPPSLPRVKPYLTTTSAPCRLSRGIWRASHCHHCLQGTCIRKYISDGPLLSAGEIQFVRRYSCSCFIDEARWGRRKGYVYNSHISREVGFYGKIYEPSLGLLLRTMETFLCAFLSNCLVLRTFTACTIVHL